MASASMNYGSRSGERAEDARGVVNQNLDAVESGVDTAIDGAKDAVHEFRGKAQDMADAILDRVNRSWQQQRPRIEAYMNAHPWVVFGGLILLAYVFSANQRSQQSMQDMTYR
jgi:CHASE3 domain sensor protein